MEWTSVKYRLPEESGFYIVYNNDDVRIAFYSADANDFVWENGNVDYWMKLPEKPNN